MLVASLEEDLNPFWNSDFNLIGAVGFSLNLSIAFLMSQMTSSMAPGFDLTTWSISVLLIWIDYSPSLLNIFLFIWFQFCNLTWCDPVGT